MNNLAVLADFEKSLAQFAGISKFAKITESAVTLGTNMQ